MAMQSAEELRNQRRVPFNRDILIDGTVLARALYISEAGLYIQAGCSFDNESILFVTIPLLDESKLTAKATVQRGHAGHGMGLTFINLSDDQRCAIKELLEGLGPEPGSGPKSF